MDYFCHPSYFWNISNEVCWLFVWYVYRWYWTRKMFVNSTLKWVVFDLNWKISFYCVSLKIFKMYCSRWVKSCLWCARVVLFSELCSVSQFWSWDTRILNPKNKIHVVKIIVHEAPSWLYLKHGKETSVQLHKIKIGKDTINASQTQVISW